MKSDHPFLTKIHELYSDLMRDRKEIALVWVPDHEDISSNSAADSAAKNALDHDVSDEHFPFSDLKPRLKKKKKKGSRDSSGRQLFYPALCGV